MPFGLLGAQPTALFASRGSTQATSRRRAPARCPPECLPERTQATRDAFPRHSVAGHFGVAVCAPSERGRFSAARQFGSSSEFAVVEYLIFAVIQSFDRADLNARLDARTCILLDATRLDGTTGLDATGQLDATGLDAQPGFMKSGLHAPRLRPPCFHSPGWTGAGAPPGRAWCGHVLWADGRAVHLRPRPAPAARVSVRSRRRGTRAPMRSAGWHQGREHAATPRCRASP